MNDLVENTVLNLEVMPSDKTLAKKEVMNSVMLQQKVVEILDTGDL